MRSWRSSCLRRLHRLPAQIGLELLLGGYQRGQYNGAVPGGAGTPEVVSAGGVHAVTLIGGAEEVPTIEQGRSRQALQIRPIAPPAADYPAQRRCENVDTPPPSAAPTVRLRCRALEVLGQPIGQTPTLRTQILRRSLAPNAATPIIKRTAGAGSGAPVTGAANEPRTMAGGATDEGPIAVAKPVVRFSE